MHQRQPISIDKGRPFSGQNGPVSSRTQVSFHKIYRKKRCYSLLNKEQNGHGRGSQWKAGLVNSQRDIDCGPRSNYSSGFSGDGRLRGNYSSGFSNRKPTQIIDCRQGNHLSSYAESPPKRDGTNGFCQQYFKRPKDRFGSNGESRPEFDEPLVKKQKVENHMFPDVQHGFSQEVGQDKQKTVSEDTKWMYKNQHAKMSGPYGVRQLIEGFHSGFLQEDLPVHQLLEGKLCKPILLKELVDDLENYSSPMHNLKRRSSLPFPEERFCKFIPSVSPNKTIKNEDLPPGFGACQTTHPERPTRIWCHTSLQSAGEKGAVGSLSPSEDDFGLPPGFEAIADRASSMEPQSTELSGSRRLHSAGAGRRHSAGAGMGIRGDGGQEMQLCYGEVEPVVHTQGHSNYQGTFSHAPLSFTRPGAYGSIDKFQQLEAHGRGHLSHQHSSSPSTVSFTLQGGRNLMDESISSEATWGLTSPNIGLSNFEAQGFSSPTVCIGFPVRKPEMPDRSAANCLPVSCSQATQADKELVPKELHKSSAKHSIDLDPLVLIHLELLAAVQRSYMKTVWSALIDEELNYWIGCKSSMAKSVVSDDSSWSREASCSLSSAEFNVSTLESDALWIDASASLAKDSETLPEERAAGCADGNFLNAHVESVETSLEIRAVQCDYGSGLSTQSTSINENHGFSPEAVSPRRDANAYNPDATSDAARLPCNRDPDLIETSVRKNTEWHQSNKAESVLSIDEGSNLSPKSQSILATSVGKSKGDFADRTEEVRQRSGDVILQQDCASLDRNQTSGKASDATLLETEPAFLVYGRKKCNIKSLSQLMKSTSKLRPGRSTRSSSKDKIDKVSGGTVPETLGTNLQVGVPSVEGYNGCARTSVDGWLWRQVLRHAPHSIGVQRRDCRRAGVQLNRQGAQTCRKQLRKRPSAMKSTRSKVKLQLARSRIHKWGVFAAEPVEAGDFVIEYVGEVIRQRIADIRERRYKCLGVGSSFLLRVDDETVVDATKRGGLARFMNYSCDPNCSSKIISVEGSKKVYIYARRHIAAGEEVTYDRKFQLEDQKVPCTCGSTRCRVPSN